VSKKTLLVLAASRYQLGTIATAKRLGYRVITTDNVPDNPGHALADRAYSVDTTDGASVLAIAREERVDGVIAPCTDVAVPTAALVARELGLSGPPLEAAQILTDKVRFRRYLAEIGIPQPRWFRVTRETLPDPAIFDEGPWILKPDSSSGSKGIFIVRSEAEFLRRRGESLEFSAGRTAILEQFIDGAQGTCEGMLQGGQVAFGCVTDRQTVEPPHTTTSGHLVPSRLPAAIRGRLIAVLERLWGLLGVTEGPFDCDFVVHGGEVYLLEMSPRLGGNSLPTLLRAAYDLDLVALAVRHACGDSAGLPRLPEPAPTAALILGTDRSGLLAFDPAELAALRGESWVLHLSLDVAAGTPVQPYINGRHRVGQALLRGADRDDLDVKVEQLRRRLAVEALP
jgi:biotin carboxylase